MQDEEKRREEDCEVEEWKVKRMEREQGRKEMMRSERKYKKRS